MAFKTFAPGVLTSSDVNTFLMRQAVITCTSSTRPASPSEGMTIYETDTDLYAHYTGSAWQYDGGYSTFAATLGGSGWTFKGHTITAYYTRVGDQVHYYGVVEWDGTGSRTAGAGSVYVTMPITPRTGGVLRRGMDGHFLMHDNSGGTSRDGIVSIDSSGYLRFGPSVNNSGSFTMNNNITSVYDAYASSGALVADDANDAWHWSITYEAA